VEAVARPLFHQREATIFLTGGRVNGLSFTRSTVTATLTIVVYIAAVAAVATLLFRRRDIAT